MRFFLFMISVIMLTFLAGCQTTDDSVKQMPPPPILPNVIVEEAHDTAAIQPLKPRLVLENIMGLSPDTLLNIFGAPALKRMERDAEVWLYGNSECRVHLYYYPNDNGDFRLDYVATTAADPASKNPTVSADACLDSLVLPERELPERELPEKGTQAPIQAPIQAPTQAPIMDPEPLYPDIGINPPPDMSGN